MTPQAHEYSFYFGYNGSSATAAAAAGAATVQQQEPDTLRQQQEQQQLAQEISSAADWYELLQIAEQHKGQQMATSLQLRLLFRWVGRASNRNGSNTHTHIYRQPCSAV